MEEPAVYETPDLADTEYNDPQPPPTYESEYISTTGLDPGEARSAFDRFEMDASSTDFLSNRPRGWKTGVRSETNAEKLARIKREVEELKDQAIDVTEVDQRLSALSNRDRVSSITTSDRISQPVNLESIEKLSLLENRLATLESRIGATTGHNLAAQVEVLRLKINAIADPKGMNEQILPHLEAFNKQASALSDTAIIARIDELHETTAIVTDMAPRVPMVVDRLRSLQRVHEDANEAQMRVDAVRAALGARAKELEEWSGSLTAMEANMKSFATTCAQNTEQMKSINQSLLERLDKIKVQS